MIDAVEEYDATVAKIEEAKQQMREAADYMAAMPLEFFVRVRQQRIKKHLQRIDELKQVIINS